MELQWWEHSYTDHEECTGLTVRIAKVGGGTLGKSYDGSWEFEVLNHSGEVIQKSYLNTGTPMTHAEAARTVISFHENEEC
jgi:hypothetical protein